MSYKVFYTDKPLPDGMDHPDYSTLIPFEEPSEELAFKKAFSILSSKGIVWRIVGPSPYVKERQTIRQMYFESTGRWPL